jgi:fumarate reductase subunit C
MVRELTCLFIGLQAFILIVGIFRLSQGREAFEAYLAVLWGPVGQFISIFILLMAVIHSVTWFNLTPKAMPLWIGDRPIPGWIIISAHYTVWLIVSVLVLLMAGGFF